MNRLLIVSLVSLVVTGCSCSRQETPPPPAGAGAPNEHAQNVGKPSSPDGSVVTGGPAAQPRAATDDSQVKSRFGRMMLNQLDKAEGGTSEERDSIRDTIRRNDPLLQRTMGEAMRRKIELNNNTYGGPRRIEIPPP